jgi:hydrogenase nickel incorporation protein HypA/HybF
MHEIALVKNIFITIEDAFTGKIEQVRSIHIQVGLLSNVQPILLQNAFAAVQQAQPMYNAASLQIQVLPILIECTICNNITEVQQYTFVCKTCNKPCKNIIQGQELMITKVEFETA